MNRQFYTIFYWKNISFFLFFFFRIMKYKVWFVVFIACFQDSWLVRRLESPSGKLPESTQPQKLGVSDVGGDMCFLSPYSYSWALYACILYIQYAHTHAYVYVDISYIKVSRVSEVCQEEAVYTVLTWLFVHMSSAFLYLFYLCNISSQYLAL